jgi:hypothetical protein
MIRCTTCGSENGDRSRFCDQCGTRFPSENIHSTDVPSDRPQTAEVPVFRSGSNITSVGISPLVADEPPKGFESNGQQAPEQSAYRATLSIERGDAAGMEFELTNPESNIGRWDADNGIFPDVDLDSLDQEAKVSRRHARIIYRDGAYYVEDLGSTNGTYVNRGRRLLPGIPQILADGDEIIVGKTFLRFHVSS